MRLLRNKKGSILILSIMLLFILLTLTLLMFTQEFVSKNSAVRSRMSTTQAQTIEVTLQRFSDTFSAKSESGKTLPTPPPSQSSSSPTYDLPFDCSADDSPSFKVKGRWKKEDSIYYPPQQNAGRDFTDVPENGYYEKITAPGYDKTNVPPWYNLVVINTPLKARYIASFAYHFPYGVFAPNGKIDLKDAYGFTNPLNAKNKNGDYFSGIPVDMYAKHSIDVEEYPYGKAYSEKSSITVKEKDGVLKFTAISKVQSDEAKKYADIIRKQLDTMSENIAKVTLNKDKAIFGRKVTTVIPFATFPVAGDIITLEQSADFPFSGMTVNNNNPSEKTMGNYYTFVVHAPNLPDKEDISTDPKSASGHASTAYDNLDDAQKIFERYGITWRTTPTEICIIQGEIALIKDIVDTATKLADAIKKSFIPIIGWYWRVKAVQYTIKLVGLIKDAIHLTKFAISFIMLRIDEVKLGVHIFGKTVDEPKTVAEDLVYKNAGWPFIKVCKIYIIPFIAEILNQNGNDKYKILGMTMAPLTNTKVRLAHFGKGDFDTNWKEISSHKFTYEGTFIIPRGRTLNFPHNMTIEGDLWIQDGAALYVGGNLTVKPPKKTPDLPDMVKPSGRVFLGTGSSIIVEKNFECKGSIPLGSVVLASPNQKVNAVTSAIYSKDGSVTIPYGIMPGIPIDELAKVSQSQVPPNIAEALKSLIDDSANISKVAGPFHFRKAFFSANAATVLVFRHKALGVILNPLNIPLVIGLKMPVNNFMNDFFPLFTQSFTYVLNAYLGENTFANSDWWIFGYEAVPILPKMDTGTLAEHISILTGISGTLQQLGTYQKTIDTILTTDSPELVINAAQSASKATASVYLVFITEGFGPGCDKKAAALANQIQQAAQQAYQPFSQIITQMDQAKDSFTSAAKLFITFYTDAYSSIQSHLPGGDDQEAFIECPGVLIYAEKDIKMGTKEKLLQSTVFPASGLFIANRDIEIKGSFRIVGCMISLNKNISAPDTHLRYYPFFSQASIYVPKDVEGDLNQNLKLVSDDDLKSNTDPYNVGVTIPRIFSEGWELYSEYYDYKPFNN